MGNAQANDTFVKEYLTPYVKTLREFYDAVDDHFRRRAFSSNARVIELSPSAQSALIELETFINEPYDPN